MKKNIGTNLALYPTPLVVVGTMVDGKPNYTLVGHLGIIGHYRIMISFPLRGRQPLPLKTDWKRELNYNQKSLVNT